MCFGNTFSLCLTCGLMVSVKEKKTVQLNHLINYFLRDLHVLSTVLKTSCHTGGQPAFPCCYFLGIFNFSLSHRSVMTHLIFVRVMRPASNQLLCRMWFSSTSFLPCISFVPLSQAHFLVVNFVPFLLFSVLSPTSHCLHNDSF